jgi:ribosome-associated protein
VPAIPPDGTIGGVDGIEVRGVRIPEADLAWRFSRSSGPGGQSVNTTDSRVELSYDVAGSTVLPEPLRERAVQQLEDRLVDGIVTVVAAEHRSQLRNREAARARLRAMLVEATAPPARARRATRPTRGSQRRRLAAKTRRGEVKALRRRPGAE